VENPEANGRLENVAHGGERYWYVLTFILFDF
jgi:hypothetical protein